MPPVAKPKRQRSRHFLRQWRNHKGLSQEEAADRADIDRSTLSRIEAGAVPYNQDLLERLALAYGCDPQDLITINPAHWDGPRLVYNALLRAPDDKQKAALAILEAFLKSA